MIYDNTGSVVAGSSCSCLDDSLQTLWIIKDHWGSFGLGSPELESDSPFNLLLCVSS